jgi:hypothetical protein
MLETKFHIHVKQYDKIIVFQTLIFNFVIKDGKAKDSELYGKQLLIIL